MLAVDRRSKKEEEETYDVWLEAALTAIALLSSKRNKFHLSHFFLSEAFSIVSMCVWRAAAAAASAPRVYISRILPSSKWMTRCSSSSSLLHFREKENFFFLPTDEGAKLSETGEIWQEMAGRERSITPYSPLFHLCSWIKKERKERKRRFSFAPKCILLTASSATAAAALFFFLPSRSISKIKSIKKEEEEGRL